MVSGATDNEAAYYGYSSSAEQPVHEDQTVETWHPRETVYSTTNQVTSLQDNSLVITQYANNREIWRTTFQQREERIEKARVARIENIKALGAQAGNLWFKINDELRIKKLEKPGMFSSAAIHQAKINFLAAALKMLLEPTAENITNYKKIRDEMFDLAGYKDSRKNEIETLYRPSMTKTDADSNALNQLSSSAEPTAAMQQIEIPISKDQQELSNSLVKLLAKSGESHIQELQVLLDQGALVNAKGSWSPSGYTGLFRQLYQTSVSLSQKMVRIIMIIIIVKQLNQLRPIKSRKCFLSNNKWKRHPFQVRQLMFSQPQLLLLRRLPMHRLPGHLDLYRNLNQGRTNLFLKYQMFPLKRLL